MNFNTIIDVIIRTIISLITLFIFTKLMGKKQISQLNIFDYVVGITIGSIAADISLDTNKNLVDGIIAMLIYACFNAMISYLTLKSIKFRRIFTGTPTMIIENGKIIEKGLEKVKFDINDLLEEARNAGYFNLEEVEHAIMESNGRISFLPSDKDKPVTKKDMKLKIEKSILVSNVIIDTKIMKHNLNVMNKDESWLLKELKVNGYLLDNILLATLDSNNKLVIYEKNVDSKYSTILE